ncbi:hypothetical protein E2562_017351 [Oryza meyeriana var. granulata]|uniref:Uncharacterized protein n=1 Tax=Oryza meyeriana var. granulata TaxID=110450 RepID=A0A6G1D4T5_9ORYZ|nr:hypothetical protein E2562_017351 [Oryza meyeriana var. granulata]
MASSSAGTASGTTSATRRRDGGRGEFAAAYLVFDPAVSVSLHHEVFLLPWPREHKLDGGVFRPLYYIPSLCIMDAKPV